MKKKVHFLILVSAFWFFCGCSGGEGIETEPLPCFFEIEAPRNKLVFYDVPDMENFNLPHDINLLPVKLEAYIVSHPGFEIDGEMIWKSCTDGFLGKGEELEVNLSIGTHRISVEHSDEKITEVKYTTIEVKEPEEYFYRQELDEVRRIREVKDQDGRLLIADFDNDLIVDISTGLMWMRRPVPYRFAHSEALIYAKSSNYAGFDNWRMPKYQELADISNLQRDGRHHTLNQVFTCRYGGYWTSTPNKTLGHYRNDFKILTYERVYARGYRYLARHTFADAREKFWVRLVRNMQ